MNTASELRKQLVAFLSTAQAHMTLSEAVKDFPEAKMNVKPPHVDYTPWQLLEHIRLTQRDLVAFMNDPKYIEPSWPDEYWPKPKEQADKKTWNKTISVYEEDLRELVRLIQDVNIDLYATVKNGNGQTIIRELLLAIDHTSYHVGEFAILRQIMQTWPAGHK